MRKAGRSVEIRVASSPFPGFGILGRLQWVDPCDRAKTCHPRRETFCFVRRNEALRFRYFGPGLKRKEIPSSLHSHAPQLRRLASLEGCPSPRIPELSSWPLPDASKRGLCSKARKKLHESAAKRLKSLHRVNLWAGPYRRGLVGQCSRRTANRNAVDRPNSIMPFSASMAPINCQCFARKTSAWP
jgi:hypothetical protein